jgi:hypothetical protein
MITKMELVEG